MLKKILCCASLLVLVSACDTMSDDPQNAAAGAVDKVYFAFDKSTLSPQAQATLDRQAAILKQDKSAKVTIEGYTDDRGTREYNLALGERRAIAVKNYLVADGVKPARIKTVSYGKERPVAIGENESAWALNRRTVTLGIATELTN
jgi:peptidoglycan-associated lipoprotein